MICKWCGANVQAPATRCNRCGKDVPAMSDCGGFYDLVPNARRNPAPAEPVRQNPQNQPPVQPIKQTPVQPAPKGKNIGTILCLLAVVVVIVMVFSLQSQLKSGLQEVKESVNTLAKNDDKLDAIADELDQLKEALQPEETQDPENTGEVDPTAPENEQDTENTDEEQDSENPDEKRDTLPLQQQDVVLEIQGGKTDAGATVRTATYLGVYQDNAQYTPTFVADSGFLSGVVISLTDYANCVSVVLENKSDMLQSTQTVQLTVDEAVFGVAQGDVEYIWSYRSNTESAWEALNPETFGVTPKETGMELNFMPVALQSLPGMAEGSAEFQLTIRRINDQGGSLTLIITGITLTETKTEE